MDADKTPAQNSKLQETGQQQEEAEAFSGRISGIEVNGNELISDEEILSNIYIPPGTALNKDLVVQQLKNIYNMGYFDARTVEARPVKKADGTVVLRFNVEENPPINDLVIYGNNQVQEVNPYDYFDDLIGKPENAKILTERIKELEQKYLIEGYIIARVKDIELDPAGTLKIYLDEGVVSDLTFTGNDRTKESYLKHLIKNVEAGKPYNEKTFVNDYKRIQSTGYFSNVSRSVKPDLTQNGYILEIDLKEKKVATFGIGAGVNSSAGIFGNANLNLGNLRGRGENLNVTALLGSGLGAGSTFNTNSNLVRRGQYTQVSASYSIPYFRDSEYSLMPYINYTRGPNFNVDLSDQLLLTGGSNIYRNFGDHHRFSLGANANFIDVRDRDRQEFLDTVADNILEIDNLTNRDVLNANQNGFLGGRREIALQEARAIRNEQIVDGFFVGIKPSYNYTDVDDNARPRDGWKAGLDLNPTMGFGDIDSFTKLSITTSRYIPYGENSSFLFNLRGGANLWGDLPQFSKFRLGSFTGIRGYKQFTDLGVGSKLLIATAEFRTPIYRVIPQVEKYDFTKNVDFALFADAGLIGGDIRLNRITERLSQAASVGFGLRVNLPLVGALRFDVGFPLIRAISDDAGFFRFNFGPANIF